MIKLFQSKYQKFFHFSPFCSHANVGNVYIEDVNSNVKRIVLNNPKRRNSLSLNLMDDIQKQFREIEKFHHKNGTVKAVILKSSIKTFSSGHDLSELREYSDASNRQKVFDTAASLMDVVENFFVPVVAAIHGPVAAAGCQLIAACDIAVCSDSSLFSTPGVLAGLFCSTPAVELGRVLPKKVIMEMILTGKPIDAKTALTHGLVNRVVPVDQVDLESEILAKQIASLSSEVISLGKKCFISQMKIPKRQAYELANRVMVENLSLPDCEEGILAFLEKRKPKWKP